MADEQLDDATLAFARRTFDLAREGATGELSALVDAGLPPNLTNDKGETLLILAAYHDHPDTVRMLLGRGADTARVNDRGQTALGAAAFRRSSESVQALLAGGADPALGSPSAIDVATFFELPEMVALLRGDATLAEAMPLLAAAQAILVVDWPSRDVPDSLAHAGFTVVVHGGPGPDDFSAYEVRDGEVVVRHVGRPPERADIVYTHRPIDELPEVVATAQGLGAAAVWAQSGLGPDGGRDPRGCWMPDDDRSQARDVVESAGLAFVSEPYIADVARAVGPRT